MSSSPNPRVAGRRASVIGAGPNGLSAAIVLAQAGLQVELYEAEAQPGGGARTMELTLPGFHHDFGSAVHPMGAASPFFNSLSLSHHGLKWIHSPAPLAHPLDDGTAVVLERDLAEAELALGDDGRNWRRLMGPFVEHWNDLLPETQRPVRLLPRHPFLMAQFALFAFPSAISIAHTWFRDARTKALFAGIAAHSVLSLDEPMSAAAGLLLGAAAHTVGWPFPKGGARSITTALCSVLAEHGIVPKTSTRIESLEQAGENEVALCDVTPRQLLEIAGDRLSPQYRARLAHYRYGPAVFKVDYALSQPIPWKARGCARAATVHIGGTMEEIAASEDAMRYGHHAEKPFVLLVQPTLFDPTRAPEGKHIAWAYCHVPNRSTVDMLPRIEAQIERFAPGFRDCVLARSILSPQRLEQMDANLIGGDISGGAMTMRQFLFRPTWRQYETSAGDIYLCSSSTPPGGGVHGMCGYNAARLALSRLP